MKAIYLFILLLFLSLYANGQDRVWKKQVSGIIITDTSSKNKNKAIDSALITTIVNAVKSRKVTTYPAYYNEFTTKMTDAEVSNLFGHTDTMTLIDPIDGHEVIKVTTHPFFADRIYRYKIFEEWVFNPATGKMNVEIKYIGPMQDVYGDDGIYRGKQTIFWLSYKDFYSLVEKQKDKQLLQTFNKYLLQSYFEIDSKKANLKSGFDIKTKTWHGDATSSIDMHEAADTVTHFLRDENADTLLSERIIKAIQNAKLPAWTSDNTHFNKLLTKEGLNKLMTSESDTQTLIDPVDGHEVIKVTYKNFLRRVYEYNILQDWSFNPAIGKMEIEINGIGPIESYYDNNNDPGIPMFWIHYSDIQPILNRIEQYHPNNTFAMHIWDSFFLSDTKPVLIK